MSFSGHPAYKLSKCLAHGDPHCLTQQWKTDTRFNKNTNQRQGRSRKTTQLVVYKTNKPRKPRQARQKIQMSRGATRAKAGPRSGSGNMGAFKTCLLDPFHRDALGARMPDEFAFPTATFHNHGTITLVSGNGVTSGSIALFPHPFLSYIDSSGGTYCGSDYLTGTNSQTYYTVNTGISGACTPSGLSAVLSEYRVVGAGWKLRVTMPELTRTGRVILAPIPGCRDLPGYNMMNAALISPGSGADLRLMAGLGIGVGGSASILALPGAFEISLSDMSTRDVQLRSKPTSALYSEFHTTVSIPSYNNTYTSSDSTGTSNLTGVVSFTDTEDLIDFSNLSGWLIHFEGLPLSTVPVVDIEYILHYEGLPALNNSRSVPTASGFLKSEINTAAFNAAVDMAAKAAWAVATPAGISNLGVLGAGRIAGRLLLN
jgi:hypothetical protein